PAEARRARARDRGSGPDVVRRLGRGGAARVGRGRGSVPALPPDGARREAAPRPPERKPSLARGAVLLANGQDGGGSPARRRSRLTAGSAGLRRRLAGGIRRVEDDA